MLNMKPLLVGEMNPYGVDPYFALYPEPRGATGDRLCRMIMGLAGGEYMSRYDRANLCTGRWSMKEARKRALELRGQKYLEHKNWPSAPPPLARVVLLGAKVMTAFGFSGPYQVICEDCFVFVTLPHPSGLNRAWNEPGAVQRARDVLVEGGIL